MRYDISKPTAPAMPNLGKGTECIKLLLSQASKDMHEPLVPMFFPIFGAHISGTEFQYPDYSWKEPTGMMANLVAHSGDNKGQLTTLAKAICRDFTKHDEEEEKKYMAWQKQKNAKGANKDKPEEPQVGYWFPPSDTTKPAFLKNAMALEAQGGRTQYFNLPEVEMADQLCGSHKHVSVLLRNVYDRDKAGALRATSDGIGGPIDLVMRYLNKDFVDACRWLADEHNVILTENVKIEKCNNVNINPFDASRYNRYFEHPWLSKEAQKFLFDERGISQRVATWCRLASWRDKQGTPWLQIPYYNRQGLLVGVQNRNLVRGSLPRFRFPQGSECGIYNLPILNLILPGEALWITEGCSDCWAMLSAGRKAIAIPSATLLSKKDKELLVSLSDMYTFHMFPDRDEPGERLFMQLKEVLPSLEHHQLPPGFKDFGEYYVQCKNVKR